MQKVNLQQLAQGINDAGITEIETEQIHDIAIIGMAVKLPYAEDLNQFWENLKNGKDCITELPITRKSEANRYLNHIRKKDSGIKYKKGSYLDGIDEFDYMYFNISHREASLMDPNQRMFLEIALSAVEDAGYGGDKLKGSKTGVYFGFVSDMAYQRFIADVEPSSLGMSIPGNMASLIPGRVSYVLDLKGPSMLIDTACSSSLVAIHTACHAIRKGDCNMAIVGGSKISLLPVEDDNMLGIESKSYICRAFDEEADGTCMGEGVMALVLKPLSMAVKDRDHIYAIIKGTAVNQDGTSMGITAPNALAQAEVIEAAWEDAGIDPETITYIEAHGTGTKLGDPIEIDGISKAFSKYTNKKQFCAVGSVKTNLGHLDSAAGMVGLIKAVLALEHGQIPPSLHFNKPNPNIDFENSPVYVNSSLIDWEPAGSPRRCGVSAFGLSGTNSHIILEEAPVIHDNNDETGAHLFTLSAKSSGVLKKLIEKYLNLIKSNEGINLGNLCYTVNTGRGTHSYRLGIITDSITDLRKKLDFIIQSELATYEEHRIFYNEVGTTNSRNQEKNYSREAIATELTAATNEMVVDLKSRDNNRIDEACRLYIQGFDVNWNDLYGKGEYRRLSLPTYPFEKRRCWIEIPSDSSIETGKNKQYHNIEGTEKNKSEAQLNSLIHHQEKRLVPVNRQAEQGIIRGEIGLLPIQRHFFGRNFTDKHHWNIPTTLIFTKEKIDETALRKAMQKVVEHHDSLRIIFQFEGGSVRQYNRGLDEGELYNLIIVDLSDEINYLEQIKKEVKEIHSSMDLTKGPLFKVGLFKTKDGNHLLIAIHHLVADGVSMEFIIEDLLSGYYQALSGGKIQLPPKTDSLMDWSKAIYQYANSPQLKEEFKYWKNIIETEIPPFPKDGNTVDNRIRDSHYYRTTLLMEEETSQLLKASRQSTHDLKTLLLTGLGYAFKEWSGYNKIPVTLLAHGREGIINDLDITRTAGWISVGYPVIIEMNSDNDISLQANHIKDTLIKIPNNGMGHDILRYITFPDSGQSLEYKLAPEIIFNFVGQSNQDKNSNSLPFTVSPIADSVKTAHITGNQDRDYTFDIVLSITGNSLQIQLNYNKYQYQESTIKKIVDGYRKNLQRIIENYLTVNNSNIGGETDIKINFIANQAVNEEEGLYREELPLDTDITNSIETVIRQVWRDVLGIVEIKRHDDFYDLGGDSLKAVQVIAKMKNYGLTLEDLIKYPTVAGLAEFTSKRHSYIEPDKLPPHLEKNLEIEYFFTKDGSIDPLAKNMDCSTMMFYYNLKRYFPNCTDYLLVFFNDISFKLTINPEGVLYNIDVNSFSDINDLYQADVHKGEGFQAISAIEELLDQGKLPIIKTYTKKLPFHKNFISFDFPVTDTPEDLAKDVHTFMAVAYDPQMLYYVEMPYVLNSNFIPYAKNKSVGVVKKDDLKHAFNVEIYYATINIKVEKLNREIDLKEKISLITSNSAQPVQNKEGYTIYSGLDALDALMTICREETLSLNQENLFYKGLDIKRIFDWKFWGIVSRRMQLKEILFNLHEKYPNVKKFEIVETIDTAIEKWRNLLGVISEKYEQKEYLFGKEYLKNLEAIKEAERKLLQKLSVI